MAKETKAAWLNWSEVESRWVLRLWIDNEWAFSKSWGVRHDGEDPVTGSPNDWVHDSVICELAHLQDLGYEVKITC